MEPVKTVVIGYGFAGRMFHSYLISLAPGLALHGVMSRDAETRERIVADYKCRAYASLDHVLTDPEVELVVVATPNSTHAEITVAALNAGKHVVTDKAMCLTLADCNRMLHAANESGKLLTVFQNRRFDGDYLTVKQTIESGELGDVKWIEMAWQGFGAWGGWRGKAEMGGGRFFDLGAHLIDQMLQLFPEPIAQVYCRMHHDYTEYDIESEALLVVTFAGGKTGVIDLSGMTAVSKPRFLVKGSKATLVKYGLDPQEDAMRSGNIDGAVESPDNYATVKGPGIDKRVPTVPGRWRNYYENIATVVREGAEPTAKQNELRRVMSVFDAALRSAKTGEAVRPASG